jgi:hypothetical protein
MNSSDIFPSRRLSAQFLLLGASAILLSQLEISPTRSEEGGRMATTILRYGCGQPIPIHTLSRATFCVASLAIIILLQILGRNPSASQVDPCSGSINDSCPPSRNPKIGQTPSISMSCGDLQFLLGYGPS